MSVHLVIGPREPVELELRRGCRRNADGSLSNLGKPRTYRAILDETRVEGATFSEAPYLLAEIQVVHGNGCAATRNGKKAGPCDCGGEATFRHFVESAGDPWELPA